MKRMVLWITVVLLGAAATVLLLREQEPVEREAGEAVAQFAPAKDVQVRHEFVTVRTPAAAPVLARKSTPPPRPVHRVRQQRESDALLAKARRAILGDGRHRPEPFPRIK